MKIILQMILLKVFSFPSENLINLISIYIWFIRVKGLRCRRTVQLLKGTKSPYSKIFILPVIQLNFRDVMWHAWDPGLALSSETEFSNYPSQTDPSIVFSSPAQQGTTLDTDTGAQVRTWGSTGSTRCTNSLPNTEVNKSCNINIFIMLILKKCV